MVGTVREKNKRCTYHLHQLRGIKCVMRNNKRKVLGQLIIIVMVQFYKTPNLTSSLWKESMLISKNRVRVIISQEVYHERTTI